MVLVAFVMPRDRAIVVRASDMLRVQLNGLTRRARIAPHFGNAQGKPSNLDCCPALPCKLQAPSLQLGGHSVGDA